MLTLEKHSSDNYNALYIINIPYGSRKCLSQNKKYEQYKNINIFVEKDVKFKCLGHQSILSYAKQNSATTIYIYQHNKPQQGDNAVYIKQSDFVTYAQERKSIKNQWLCKAFLNKDIDVENIKNNATAEQKGEIIQSLSGEEVLNCLSPEQRQIIAQAQLQQVNIPQNLTPADVEKILTQLSNAVKVNPQLPIPNINILESRQKNQSLAEFKKHIENNESEGVFQKFFETKENQWILSSHQVGGKYFFSKNNGTRSGNEVDFIFTNALGHSAVVEIKTPKTDLLKRLGARTDIYNPSEDLTTAVSQAIHYHNKAVQQSDTKNAKTFLSNAISFVIIGKYANLSDDVQRTSFDLYRNNCKDVVIITYDELYNIAETLMQLHTDVVQQTT